MSLQLSTSSLLAVLLAAIRAAAWLIVSPPFGTRVIPGPVKALLAVAIGLLVAPGLVNGVPVFTTGAILSSAVQQVAIGGALGFLTSLVFAALQSAGSLIDVFGGFAVAFAFDPLSMTANSVFGRFYNLLAITLLFVSNAHLLVLRGFARSYQVLPLDGSMSLGTLDRLLTEGLVQMFIAALQIAGPLIAVLFCADIALGLLGRIAPGLNAFALGFPVKLLLTLGLAGLGLVVLPQIVAGLTEQAVSMMMRVMGR